MRCGRQDLQDARLRGILLFPIRIAPDGTSLWTISISRSASGSGSGCGRGVSDSDEAHRIGNAPRGALHARELESNRWGGRHMEVVDQASRPVAAPRASRRAAKAGHGAPWPAHCRRWRCSGGPCPGSCGRAGAAHRARARRGRWPRWRRCAGSGARARRASPPLGRGGAAAEPRMRGRPVGAYATGTRRSTSGRAATEGGIGSRNVPSVLVEAMAGAALVVQAERIAWGECSASASVPACRTCRS